MNHGAYRLFPSTPTSYPRRYRLMSGWLPKIGLLMLTKATRTYPRLCPLRHLLTGWAITGQPLVVGGAVAGAALAPIIIPSFLGGVGFTTGGVAAASWASVVQASIGNVAGGSLFAVAQSVGAGGALPAAGWLVGTGLGALAGLLAKLMHPVWMLLEELMRPVLMLLL
jgi:hypothetical protein